MFLQQSMRVVSLCNRLSRSIQLRKSTDTLNSRTTMSSRNTLDEEVSHCLCLSGGGLAISIDNVVRVQICHCGLYACPCFPITPVHYSIAWLLRSMHTDKISGHLLLFTEMPRDKGLTFVFFCFVFILIDSRYSGAPGKKIPPLLPSTSPTSSLAPPPPKKKKTWMKEVLN